MSFRLGKKDDAKRLFEEQLTLYPTSNEIPAAIYWRARIAEDEGDKAEARAYYEKLSKIIATTITPIWRAHAWPSLDSMKRVLRLRWPGPGRRHPTTQLGGAGRQSTRPEGQSLANAALFDFAVKELQSASAGSPPWLAKSLAEVYGDQGSYIHAIESLKRLFPGIFGRGQSDSAASVGRTFSRVRFGMSCGRMPLPITWTLILLLR